MVVVIVQTTLPSWDEVKPDTPLRLSVAAAVAFPDGTMTASGLRKEGARGRLVIERIAGKDYTTLANIDRMRELCRVEAKGHACGSDQPGGARPARLLAERSGSFSTGASTSPRDALKAKLSAQSKS